MTNPPLPAKPREDLDAIDTGDTVLHEPSGETWTVACVRDGYLSWCGWPAGQVALSDCRLIEKATPATRAILLHLLARSEQTDHRANYARERIAREFESQR